MKLVILKKQIVRRRKRLRSLRPKLKQVVKVFKKFIYYYIQHVQKRKQ